MLIAGWTSPGLIQLTIWIDPLIVGWFKYRYGALWTRIPNSCESLDDSVHFRLLFEQWLILRSSVSYWTHLGRYLDHEFIKRTLNTTRRLYIPVDVWSCSESALILDVEIVRLNYHKWYLRLLNSVEDVQQIVNQRYLLFRNVSVYNL